MSLQDLFGSDSDEAPNENEDFDPEQMQSTQAQMEELFGNSDDDDSQDVNNENKDIGRQSSDDEDSGERHTQAEDQMSETEEQVDANSDSNDSDGNIRQRMQENISDIEDDDDEQMQERASEQNGASDDEPELEFGEDEFTKGSNEEERSRPTAVGSDDEDFDKSMKELDELVSDDDSNQKEEGTSSQAVPTHADLFGDHSDVSSDEDEDQRIDDQTLAEDGINEPQMDSQEQLDEEQDEEDEGVSIAIELPKCDMALSRDLFFIKLPNFLSVETKPFDPNFYEDEIDEDEVLDEEGRARLKLKVENTIRWRYAKDKDGNDIKESNARVVKWSDGSMSLHLGNEIFDVFKMPIQGKQNQLFVQQGTGLKAQAVFKNKLSFRPHSTTSQTHRKMTMSIAERMSKAQKIRLMPAALVDPMSERDQLAKVEEERERARMRRESQQRRMREKRHTKEMTSSYLEQDMEEDDFDESIAMIKNKYKKDIKRGRERLSERDSDDEDRLLSAKLDISSDDDSDGGKKAGAEKKKSGRKIIEESDDDDSG